MDISEELVKKAALTIDESEMQRKQKFHAYKNLLVVSIVFLLVFSSYDSLQNIQTSIHSDPSLGFASLCTIYAMFAVSSLIVPAAMINKTGYKYTMFISIFGYMIFTSAHFYPRWWVHITASIIIGLSAAPLWAAQSAYVVELAVSYANTINIAGERIISKFLCLFYLIKQIGLLSGNAVSSLILKPTKYANISIYPSGLCGSNFTPESVLPPGTQQIEDRMINLLIGIYLGVMLIAVIILFLFLDRSTKEKEDKSIRSLLISTIKQLKNRKMQMLIPLAVMFGLEQGFMFGDFTKAFVTCSVGIEMVGFILICFAVTSCITSLLLGVIVKWTGICLLMAAALIIHSGLIIFLLYFQLGTSPIVWLLLISGIWGVCDSIWQTQISATFGTMFPERRVEALSLLKLYQSLGYVISFSYGNLISTKAKLYILLSILVTSMVLYLIVEHTRKKVERKNQESRGEEDLDLLH